MKSKESGKTETGSDEIIYKIDVPANRYDILCLEGLARALRIFRGSEVPQYRLTKPKTLQKMIIKSEVSDFRLLRY
jgi:phenylalanyl-tRNA synthetase beta chain